MFRAHPAARTASGLLAHCDQVQYREVVLADFHGDHLHPGQAEQTGRIVGQARGPSWDPSSFATRMSTKRHGRLTSIKPLVPSPAHPRHRNHGQVRRAPARRCKFVEAAADGISDSWPRSGGRRCVPGEPPRPSSSIPSSTWRPIFTFAGQDPSKGRICSRG